MNDTIPDKCLSFKINVKLRRREMLMLNAFQKRPFFTGFSTWNCKSADQSSNIPDLSMFATTGDEPKHNWVTIFGKQYDTDGVKILYA